MIEAIVQILVFFIIASISFYVSIRARHAEKASELLDKQVKIVENKVILPETMFLEKGWVRVSIPFTKHYQAFASSVRWRGARTFIELKEIPFSEICDIMPLIISNGEHLLTLLPALKITKGTLKDVIIACLNTRLYKTRSYSQLVYENGYVKTGLIVANGNIDLSVEWYDWITGIQYKGASRKRELHVEICSVSEYIKCIEIAKFKKPGVYNSRSQYPLVTNIILLHKYGSRQGLTRLMGLISGGKLMLCDNPVIKLKMSS
ncbi:MAG: hypothetical protein QXE81_04950 [Desulfurococcaceae archaeon]